ncbi:UDP-glycosyltransferase UGT5-like [Periplaneta americana]|uniref:UDP-glycosyltransferase UGT5-like n=1 Tax=Periplaneta americana TaxID=6978 RepID=UPI0037E7BD53
MQRFYGLVLCVLVASTLAKEAEAARILALMITNFRSHYSMIQPLLKGLVSRGHEVTMVGYFPLKTPIANYTDISLEGILPPSTETMSVEELRSYGYIKVLYLYWQFEVNLCKVAIESPQIQKLINSKNKFDLIITHLMGSDCFLVLSHHFKASLISLTTSVSLPWGNDRIGNIDHAAYIPNYFLPFADHMSFWQRLVNTVFIEAAKLGHYIFAELPTDELMRRHFGQDVPSIFDIKRNTSLVLINSHFSLNTPRPTVPAFVEVGGIHINSQGSLPVYLEEFLNGAEHGAIYISFGTNIQSDSFPPDKLQAFIGAFSKLPQRVLWKTSNMTGLPENIMTRKWFPQLEILRHPNTRVFITHGGQFGTLEAVYCGVPMLGIPISYDQHLNIKTSVAKEVALHLDYEFVTEEVLLEALKKLLYEPSYRINSQKLSNQFRDRHQSPLDTALFWTEYVIKHSGAQHLRSAAVDLCWYQYLLLDVVLFFCLVFILIGVLLYYVSKALLKSILIIKKYWH